jgi:HEAT repeat protein
LQLLSSDPELEVRAAAATALGLYVYAGEIETIPKKLSRQVVESLLAVTRSEEPELVRRMALESLGYSSRDEVPDLIEAAYDSGSTEWIASALYAMGRSASKSWRVQVLASLRSVMPAIRLEAARAAGELELKEARSRLYELLDDPDDETRLASIWSLSQIGGDGVQEALEKLYSQSDSEDELAFLDEALDNLEYTEEVRLLPILDLSETDITGDLEEDEDITWFSDLEEEDEDEDEPD